MRKRSELLEWKGGGKDDGAAAAACAACPAAAAESGAGADCAGQSEEGSAPSGAPRAELFADA